MQEFFSHPWFSTPIAVAATVNPWWMNPDMALSRGLQVLGGVYLVMQIYYLFKNKGKK